MPDFFKTLADRCAWADFKAAINSMFYKRFDDPTPLSTFWTDAFVAFENGGCRR